MDFSTYSGSSKQRRDLLKNETDKLGKELPFDYGKVSQLRILKAACNYLKKEKHFGKLRETNEKATYADSLICNEDTLKNESFSGFLVCFTKLGELVHVSDTSYEHLGLRSLDILFTYDNISDMIHEHDKHYVKDLEINFSKYKNGATFSFYTLWFVSKIRRHEKSLTEYKLIRMSGHYDKKTDLYIATCTQILSVSNREILTGISADCFTSIHDSKLTFQLISMDVKNLLGYDLNEDSFETKSLYELLAPESLNLVKERHLQILCEKNTKGYLDPVKILHKNGSFIDCLMNLYCDMKDQIICKYQIIDANSMIEYKKYVVNFKRDWSLYKFYESASSSFNSESVSHLSSASSRHENEYSNFISIEDATFDTNAPSINSVNERTTKRVRSDFSESDEFDLSLNDSCNSPKRFKNELNNETSVDINQDYQLNYQQTNFNTSDEIGSFNMADEAAEISCFDLNEIIEINNIKEKIEKELYSLQDNSFIPDEIEHLKINKFEPVQNYFNQNDECNSFFNQPQHDDQELYESLLQDNDLFQCLQQAF